MSEIPGPELKVITDQTPGQFYTLSYCARKCGVRYEQFRRALRAGLIPMPFYTNASKHMLFTFGQMEAIIHTYRRYQRGVLRRDAIRRVLDEHWND